MLLDVELERDAFPIGVAPEAAHDEPLSPSVLDDDVVVPFARKGGHDLRPFELVVAQRFHPRLSSTPVARSGSSPSAGTGHARVAPVEGARKAVHPGVVDPFP